MYPPRVEVQGTLARTACRYIGREASTAPLGKVRKTYRLLLAFPGPVERKISQGTLSL